VPNKKTQEVRFSDLRVGMKVLFHDSIDQISGPTHWINEDMRKNYLGKVCTVKQIHAIKRNGIGTFYIAEDDELWFWRAAAVKEIVYEDDFDVGEFNLDLLLR